MEGSNIPRSDANRKPADTHPFFTPAIAITAAMLVAAVVGCGKGSSAPSGGDESTASESISAQPAGAPKKRDLEHPVVRIETSAGPISVKLDAVRAPGTTRNFLNYVDEKFYDNSLVHFVDPGAMIVAGGYAADRSPKKTGAAIRNEAHNRVKNTRGTIAMTRDRAVIDSSTSQFFINLADAPNRDYAGDTPEQYGYCVFGEVTDGLDVADKISKSSTANQGGDLAQTPDPPVVIKTMRVVQ